MNKYNHKFLARITVIVISLYTTHSQANNYIYSGPESGYTNFSIGGTLAGGDSLYLDSNMNDSTLGTVIKTSATAGDVTIAPFYSNQSYVISSNANTSVIGLFLPTNIGNVTIASGITLQKISNSNSVSARGIYINNSGTNTLTNNGIINCVSNVGNTQAAGMVGFNAGLTMINNGSIIIRNYTIGGSNYGIGGNPFSAVINNGTIDIHDNYNNSYGIIKFGTFTGTITNNGTITSSHIGIGVTNGSATVTNTGTITAPIALSGNGGVATVVLNGGSINGNIELLHSITFGNNTQSNINGNITTTPTITVNSGATANINGDISLTSTFISNGTVRIQGNRNLAASSYTNTGTQNFVITNANTYDSLNASCSVNLSGAVVNVTSSFVGAPNQTYSWQLLSASSLTSPAFINPPSSSLNPWSSVIASNKISVFYNRASFSSQASSTLNGSVANTLDLMTETNMNAAQNTLTGLVASTPTNAALNNAFHVLIPIQNTNLASIKFQNVVFARTEGRIADASKYSNNFIYSAGDGYREKAFWIAPFSSWANQGNIGENQGYHASTWGSLIGVDRRLKRDNLFGGALGYSRSKTSEASNYNFLTYATSFYALLYGQVNLEKNYLYEWLLSGNTNSNKSSRYVLISGSDISTTSSYNSYQIGAKFNFGRDLDYGVNVLTPLATLQYGYVHQPSYSESGGVAALNVYSNNSNVVTIGVGARFGQPGNEWNLQPARQIRVMLTDDIVSTGMNTTSSFVAGSQDFTVSSNPSRVALKMGADLGYNLLENLIFKCSYDLELRNKYNDQSIMLEFKWVF